MSELAKRLFVGPPKIALPTDDSKEALVGNITHGAFSNPYFKALLAKYGKTAFARSSACMEFEAFLRRLNIRGSVALEIGTFYGSTAIILSQYFDKVVCVSVDVDSARLQKYEFVRYLGINNIQFFDVENNAEKKSLVDRIDFDFCYSDGDHINDSWSDFELVKRCGRVLMHEAWALQPAVWNLAHSLPKDEVTWAEFDCFAYWERK